MYKILRLIVICFLMLYILAISSGCMQDYGQKNIISKAKNPISSDEASEEFKYIKNELYDLQSSQLIKILPSNMGFWNVIGDKLFFYKGSTFSELSEATDGFKVYCSDDVESLNKSRLVEKEETERKSSTEKVIKTKSIRNLKDYRLDPINNKLKLMYKNSDNKEIKFPEVDGSYVNNVYLDENWIYYKQYCVNKSKSITYKIDYNGNNNYKIYDGDIYDELNGVCIFENLDTNSKKPVQFLIVDNKNGLKFIDKNDNDKSYTFIGFNDNITYLWKQYNDTSKVGDYIYNGTKDNEIIEIINSKNTVSVQTIEKFKTDSSLEYLGNYNGNAYFGSYFGNGYIYNFEKQKLNKKKFGNGGYCTEYALFKDKLIIRSNYTKKIN